MLSSIAPNQHLAAKQGPMLRSPEPTSTIGSAKQVGWECRSFYRGGKLIRDTRPWPALPTNLLGAKMKAQASFASALANHLCSKNRGPFPASLKVLVGKIACLHVRGKGNT